MFKISGPLLDITEMDSGSQRHMHTQRKVKKENEQDYMSEIP